MYGSEIFLVCPGNIRAHETKVSNSCSIEKISTLPKFHPVAINNHGYILGFAELKTVRRAALLKPSKTIYLNVTRPLDINNLNSVLADRSNKGVIHYYILNNQAQKDLGASADIRGINDRDEMIAIDDGKQFYIINNKGLKIQNIGNSTDNIMRAIDLNNQRQCIGIASSAKSGKFKFHAFVASSKKLIDLGNLGGDLVYPFSINNKTQIVGEATLRGNKKRHAFIWYKGHMYDMNSLLPINSGWKLNFASGINDLGEVVGNGTFKGKSAAYILKIRFH